MVFPELDDLEPLFSDQEEVQPETLTRNLIPSPSGTSAPLLSNPSLAYTLSNFPLLHPNESRPLVLTEQPQTNVEHESQNPEPLPSPCSQATQADKDDHEVDPMVAKISVPLPQAEARRLLESQRCGPEEAQGPRFSTIAPPRTHDRAMTLPAILESSSLVQLGSREDTSTQAPRYQLRANRAPRYKCGTCGSRSCSCVHQITTEPPGLRTLRTRTNTNA